jgi:hypothetical protein
MLIIPWPEAGFFSQTFSMQGSTWILFSLFIDHSSLMLFCHAEGLLPPWLYNRRP